MSEHKLEGPRNAPEWFEKEYCKNCIPKCLAYELKEAADPKIKRTAILLQTRCMVANILFELVHLSECLFGEQWKKEAEGTAAQKL